MRPVRRRLTISTQSISMTRSPATRLAQAPRLLAVDPEDDEEKQALEQELVDLRRMAWQRRARLREDHRPRQARVGEPPPELAVDEVADAAGGEAGRHARRDQVGHLEERPLARARNQRERDHH